MNSDNSPQINGKIIFRIVVCAVILLVGFLGMTILGKMKKPPAEAPIEERPLRVEIHEVKQENITVNISGYGEVKVLDKVTIAPEVSGRIIHVHPRLDQGEILAKDSILFTIDPSDYQTARDGARAEVERLQNTIQLFRKQLEIDRDRLQTIERNRDLAKANYLRQKKLFEQGGSSLAEMEKLEQAYNTAVDQAAQTAKLINLYPLQIKEAEKTRAGADSRLASARIMLARCEVSAPFTGRVAATTLETGQYVSPGQPVLTLADDSILEIPVPLDSLEARKWLRFNKENTHQENGWITNLEPVECAIRWTEDDKSIWKGQLHRVMQFDPNTRTLTVAVRVKGNQTMASQHRRLPLVEGMFCSVSIPGRSLEGVFRLPRWAVSFKDTVYVAIDNRLKTIPVEVARIEGESAYVSGGLKEGDRVIVTRLVEPLENSLLEIVHKDKIAGESP